MVNGEGHLSESFAGEYHEAHAVVLASVDKLGSYLFRCFETVGTEVFGQHTAGYVHRHNDVDAFNLHLLAAQLALRTGQSHHQSAYGQCA